MDGDGDGDEEARPPGLQWGVRGGVGWGGVEAFRQTLHPGVDPHRHFSPLGGRRRRPAPGTCQPAALPRTQAAVHQAPHARGRRGPGQKQPPGTRGEAQQPGSEPGRAAHDREDEEEEEEEETDRGGGGGAASPARPARSCTGKTGTSLQPSPGPAAAAARQARPGPALPAPRAAPQQSSAAQRSPAQPSERAPWPPPTPAQPSPARPAAESPPPTASPPSRWPARPPARPPSWDPARSTPRLATLRLTALRRIPLGGCAAILSALQSQDRPPPQPG